MNDVLQLGTASARPGRKSWGQLHVREGRKKVSLPVCAVHGSKQGPHAVVVANQHGQEVNGIESVRRFCEQIDPNKLRGTLFAIPSMNPIATMLQQQVWREGDRDVTSRQTGDHYKNEYNMNWNWPGNKGSLLVQRVTHEVWHRAMVGPDRKASLVIDIHCHERQSSIYAYGIEAMKVALLTGLRYIHLQHRIVSGPPGLPRVCDKAGIANVTVELATQRVFNRKSIHEGVRLIRNLLKYRGMLDGKLTLPPKVFVFDPWGVSRPKRSRGRTYVEICSRHNGIVVPHKISQERVRKGDLICEVLDPHTAKVLQSVHAPKSGYLHMVLDYEPVVKKGQRLCLIALIAKIVNPAKEFRRSV